VKSVHITLTEFRNESRLIKEARSLVSLGVSDSVRIFALGAQDLPGEEEVSQGVFVTRFSLKTRNFPKNIFWQAIKFLEFSFRCLLESSKLKPDVLSVHALALLPLGILSKVVNGHALVYDAHELETERAGLSGFRKRIAKWLERKTIPKCDLVIVVSESIADWYEREYSIARPCVVMNAPLRREKTSSDKLRERLGVPHDQYILLYQGGLSKVRGIQVLLAAMTVRSDRSVAAVFMGYGELEQEIIKASKQSSNVFYLPAVPPGDVLEWTASADFGAAFIVPTCLSYLYCMPNKLFEYAMVGLPVLSTKTKDMADMVLDRKMGVVVDELTADGVNAAIDRLVNSPELPRYRENAYQTALQYSWEVQEEKLLSAYQSAGLSGR